LGGGRNDWRIRVGDYRIIYEIADEIRIVRVNRIRHRREVYSMTAILETASERIQRQV
jgi:mRNA interferase RelE/StbE